MLTFIHKEVVEDKVGHVDKLVIIGSTRIAIQTTSITATDDKFGKMMNLSLHRSMENVAINHSIMSLLVKLILGTDFN